MKTRIAGYEIIDDLGRNAWGKSYRAVQVSLDRPVHLTFLPPEDKAPAIHARARICAALTHPHLISGIDLAEHEGRKYIVTEWVEGPSVGDVLRRGGPLAEERALEIVLAAASGLEFAAHEGIVHGKVNPEALIIAKGGNPKLRGFGADRLAIKTDEDYRPPEKKRGERLDARSDIWCLGAVLHAMLSGAHPFEGAPPPEVVDGEVRETPRPLRQTARNVSNETVELAARMMAHRPSDRFGSAGDLVEAVEKVIEKLDRRISFQAGRPARPGTRRRGRPRRRPRRR